MPEAVNNNKIMQTYQEFYKETTAANIQAHKAEFSQDALAAVAETLRDVCVEDNRTRGHAVSVIRVISTADGITTEQRDDFYRLVKEANPELFEFHKQDNKYGHFPNPKFA